MTLAHLPHPSYPATVVQQPTTSAWVELVAPAAELAQQISGTDFVPQEMRNNPAAITACILFGAELGLGPMVSLSKIAMVKGRPAPYAELARALALGAGHELWVEDQSNTRCKVSGRRRGSSQVQSVTWTTDDVKKAGITSHMYSKYPRQMLFARASTELVRMMCPEVLGGIEMTAEEVEGLTDDGPTFTAAPEPAPAKQTRRRATPAPVEQVAPPAPPLDEPASDGPTAEQIKKMMAQFNELGLRDREDRLTFIAAAVRRVGSSKELTVNEASVVIDVLDKALNGGVSIVWMDGEMQIDAVDSVPNDDMFPEDAR